MQRAARAATGFDSLGHEPGYTVAMLLRNDFVLFECLAASRLCSACLVPINWHFHGEEIRYLLDDSEARILVLHADLLPEVEAWLPDDLELLLVETPAEIAVAYGISPERAAVPEGRRSWDDWVAQFEPVTQLPDPAGTIMLYTSGTTGRPKGVKRLALTEEQHAVFYQQIARVFAIEPGATVAVTGPLYHSAPLAHANVSLLADCSIHLAPRFDPEALLAMIQAERITHMHIVPTMMVRLLKLPEAVRAAYDVSSLVAVSHGAAPCPSEIKRAMIEWWGPVIREYYGSTEASIISVCTSQEFLERPGTVGRPLESVRVEVVNDAGRLARPGEVGELYAGMAGAPDFDYHKRSDERREIDRNGLVTNGDLGYLDDAGYLYLCDRKRDMVISGGVNIYPAEIEAVLINLEGVQDCAVFGIPDSEFGEKLAAFIQPEPGVRLNEATVAAFLTSRLARYKVPKHIEFADELPRQDNGKIYKRKLRAPFWESQGRQI